MKTVKAKYLGRCVHCARRYDAGDDIAAHDKRWGHAKCAEEAIRAEREHWTSQPELNQGEGRNRPPTGRNTPADRDLHKRVTELLNGAAC